MKSVLLLAPPFFDYYRDIVAELEGHDFHVDYRSDRPADTVFFKSVSRLSYRFVDAQICAYVDELVALLQRKRPDIVLCVGGMSFSFSRSQFTRLKKAAPSARFIAYFWDSITNCQRVLENLENFDRVLSFEKSDCEKHGLIYLPLFFSPEYRTAAVRDDHLKRFDACFVGSVHQVEKFVRVEAMVNELRRSGRDVFTYYYMPSRSVAALRWLQHPLYRATPLHFEPMSRQEIVDLYSRSTLVIDSPQEHQEGVTMRALEALAAGCKLLTANTAMRECALYQSGNVTIWKDPDSLTLPSFDSPAQPIAEHLIDQFSLRHWCEVVLDEGKATENAKY